jgi:hypothetical protein
MSLYEGFFWGFVGGGIAELLGWFKLRHQAPAELPTWMRTRYYWGCTLLMMASGGLLVIAYMRSEVKLNAITAMNVGASAPLLLQSFISQTPNIGPGRVD